MSDDLNIRVFNLLLNEASKVRKSEEWMLVCGDKILVMFDFNGETNCMFYCRYDPKFPHPAKFVHDGHELDLLTTSGPEKAVELGLKESKPRRRYLDGMLYILGEYLNGNVDAIHWEKGEDPDKIGPMMPAVVKKIVEKLNEL